MLKFDEIRATQSKGTTVIKYEEFFRKRSDFYHGKKQEISSNSFYITLVGKQKQNQIKNLM